MLPLLLPLAGMVAAVAVLPIDRHCHCCGGVGVDESKAAAAARGGRG